MTGRVLSEEEIQMVESRASLPYFHTTLSGKKDVLNLIATIRDLRWQVNHASEMIKNLSGNVLHWEETAKHLDRIVKDGDKTILELRGYIQKQSFSHLHQLTEQVDFNAKIYALEQQNTIMREALERITDSSGSTLEWSYVWEIALEALSKVNNV